MRQLGLLLLLGWAWVVLSTLVVLTPVATTNDYRQTIARWTWQPQIPVSGDEAVRYAAALEVASGRGFRVPDVLAQAPGTVHVPARQGEGTTTLRPRFTPLYGLLLGGLTSLASRIAGVAPDALDPLTLYRVLALVPNLIAVTLLAWFFGQSIQLRGLSGSRWWVLVLPVLFLSPLALRMTYLTEHALGAALLWTGLAQLNTALFRIAKDQPARMQGWRAGALLMLACGIVPVAGAAVIGFGGVLLATRPRPLQQLGQHLALGALPVALLLVGTHMWGFNKLLPLIVLHQANIGASVQYFLQNLLGYNGLLWMFPPALIGTLILVSRIIRTQELEEAQQVDLFRAGQGIFHWGAYWTLLAAVGLAIIDGAFGYGVPASEGGKQIGILVPTFGGRTQITFYLHQFGGDALVSLLPLLGYYCAFIFREPILQGWQPWYHNAVRLGVLVWVAGTAQPAGALVCPLIEAVYRWSVGLATYYPAGRLS